jgi:hypothetical protein
MNFWTRWLLADPEHTHQVSLWLMREAFEAGIQFCEFDYDLEEDDDPLQAFVEATNVPCGICWRRKALCHGWMLSTWGSYLNYSEYHCGDPLCAELWSKFYGKEKENKNRREMFKNMHGCYVSSFDPELRMEAMLATELRYQANAQQRADHQNDRRIARSAVPRDRVASSG